MPTYKDKLKPVAPSTASYASKLKPLAPPAAPQAPKPLGSRIVDTALKAGSSLTNFIGGGPLAATFGDAINRVRLPESQKQFLPAPPSLKSVVGSGLQVGSLLIPGAGVSAGLASKVATGAATGYAMDVGSKLEKDATVGQALKPGLATAIGATLPIAGKLTGLGNAAKATQKTATTLEKFNLKMTPVEQQNAARQGKQIAEYLASKRIVGSPAQRYGKVVNLYDDMERQITRIVDGSNITYPKQAIVDELKKIPSKYLDNLSEYDNIVSKVERMIKTLTETKGGSISASSINKMKRAEWANAYNRQESQVINEVSDEIGHLFKNMLDDSISGLNKINNEYGTVIAARKALFKATSRNQAGLFGKAAGLVAGAGLGGAIAGPGGAAVGAFVGPQVVNAVSTPIRSAVGAGLQTASNAISKTPMRGVVQPVRKALMQAASSSQSVPPAETPVANIVPPKPQSQELLP